MKRIYLILAVGLLALSPSVMRAQWRVGISGGGDYNWYTINTNYQTDYRYDGAWGWNAAVFGQYNFFDWLGLRFELEASERNYRFRRTGIYSGTNYVTHNTYMHLPVMTQFSFGGKKVRGFVNTGVYAGYWLAGRYKGRYYETMSDRLMTVEEPYIFQNEKDQRWDFGLAGGIGIEYRFLEHWMMHVEGRCYYSFISQTKPYMQIKDNRYNTTICMHLGFAYVF